MKSLWNEEVARQCNADALKERVYTSRLLGQEPSLVLHGGGNTSVKAEVRNLFGESEKLIYVKGSGWDLATIEAPGFSPVRMETLLKLARLSQLTDADMVKIQKAAMTDSHAPNPSVEAILHALIPFKFVDHTHADAIVAVTNAKGGLENVREIFGDRVLIVPYVMPGFVLARKVFEMTIDMDWRGLDGMILMNHGIFTFADSAKEAYEQMIKLVTKAEEYIARKGKFEIAKAKNTLEHSKSDLLQLATLRKAVSQKQGCALVSHWNQSQEAIAYSQLPQVSDLASRGPLTPDHVIHTKRVPLVIDSDQTQMEMLVDDFSKNYVSYFQRNVGGQKLTCLDPAPRFVVWQDRGIVSFGVNVARAKVVADVSKHTLKAVQWSESLGGWNALGEKEIFDVEYWELEQAKLKKSGTSPIHQGKVAIVTGAASGIGKACVDSFLKKGAAVVGLDLDAKVKEVSQSPSFLGLVCDLTHEDQVQNAVGEAVRRFGGLDLLVSNAGSFPPGRKIEELASEQWHKTVEVNLNSHYYLLHAAIPYLKLGISPAITIIASKNVPAPGPGASAYSASKAGLTQLARVAALELGEFGIRVNVVHPNAVFDTGIWTEEVLKNRAKHYGMTVEQYKKNNVLSVEVSSRDVAEMATEMAGPLFAKTTGAQVAIDGGNDRVI